MITVEEATPSPEPTYRPSLADLSRNASVISTSSSSEDTHGGQGLLNTPGPSRPRPLRTFSSPRSRSPGGPTTPRSTRPPAYLTRELGLPDDHPQVQAQQHSRSRNASKSKSRTRSRSAGRPSADDYDFGQILGEGSYSTVRPSPECAIDVVLTDSTRFDNRCSKPLIVLPDRSTLSRLSTRAISSVTISCRQPMLRRTPSSGFDPAILASFASTLLFTTNGLFVRVTFSSLRIIHRCFCIRERQW